MWGAYELMKLSFSGQETRNVRPASKTLRNTIILGNNAQFQRDPASAATSNQLPRCEEEINP